MDAAWEDPIKRDRHGIRLRWFTASKLTLARPKAPHVAGRALSASAGEQVNRPTHITMRPLRQKSRPIRGCNAFETSQLIRCRRRSHLWAEVAAAGFGGATFRMSG